MAKEYRLKNGCKITKITCYDGYKDETRWGIFAPDGSLYRSCSGWNEAYELASHSTFNEDWKNERRYEYDS